MIYSHDGIHDSLTNLAAPPLFYAELKRDISKYERNLEPFTLLKFLLLSPSTEGVLPFAERGSLHESELLHFAEALTTLTRQEDLCARMGDREFLVIFRAPASFAILFLERLAKKWAISIQKESSAGRIHLPDFSATHLFSQLGESSLELLNRLDREPLNFHSAHLLAN